MILSGHQAAYLPWLGYFHKIALCDVFMVVDDTQYERRSFTNRNKIKTNNGELMLSVPMKIKGNYKTSTKDLLIDNSNDWRKKHWKSIFLAYQKAPFFEEVIDWLEPFYREEWTNLVDLTYRMNLEFMKRLGIDRKVVLQSELGVNGVKQDLVMDMCRRMGADVYISGVFGKDYIDVEYFSSNGIRMYFQEYSHPTYSQLHGDFLPYMSCLDLLMNVGERSALGVIFEGNDRAV
jgi:hypothetical protein